jgi:hypothetical protein
MSPPACDHVDSVAKDDLTAEPADHKGKDLDSDHREDDCAQQDHSVWITTHPLLAAPTRK